MNKYLILAFFLIAGIVLAGCIEQSSLSSVPASPEITEILTPEPTAYQAEPEIQQANDSQVDETIVDDIPVPTPLSVSPVPTQTTEPNLAFREKVTKQLDLIQEGKTKVLDAWKAGDITATGSYVEDLRHFIRNNNDASTFPKKMDYVRVSYYDFTDRMSQFVDNFGNAAALMEKGQNSSANSYGSAGIMAGDRADISDKRIRVFLEDHPVLL